VFQDSRCIVLDGVDLACLYSIASIKFRVFKLFVQSGKLLVIVGFIFLVFHLEAEHHVLTHFTGILAGFYILD